MVQTGLNESNLNDFAGFEVLTTLIIKSTTFWDITLVSCWAYFSTLKMEAICSSETSVG
jgi:hypothetical protein